MGLQEHRAIVAIALIFGFLIRFTLASLVMSNDCSRQAGYIGNEVCCCPQVAGYAIHYAQNVVPCPVVELEANDWAGEVKPDSSAIASGTNTNFNPTKPSAIKLCIGHVVGIVLLGDFLGDFAVRDVDQALAIRLLLVDQDSLQALQVPAQEGREVVTKLGLELRLNLNRYLHGFG